METTRVMSSRIWSNLGVAAALGLSGLSLVVASGGVRAPDVVQGVQAAPSESSVNPDAARDRTTARALEEAFIAIAEQVGPSVVTIQVEAEVKRPRGLRHFFGIPPFEGFRFPDGDEEGDEDRGGFTPFEPRGGSGVIISPDGYIVTNNHVVEDAQAITVVLSDERELKAEVRGTDPESDIAVIQVEALDLPAARWADPKTVRVGAWAIALGAPFGLDKTLTVGHVSGLGRQLGRGTRIQFQDFIQTDASINPGNSGGPLVNLDGEVMGINTAILGIGTGVGFAVPSKIARAVAGKLIAEGKVSRPYLGVQVEDVNPDQAEALELPNDVRRGALVQRVMPDTPAAKARLETGDVIVRVGGEAVRSAQELVNEVARHEIGEKVDIEFYRSGKRLKVAMVTATRPGPDSAVAAIGKPEEESRLGLELQGTDPDINRSLDREPKAPGVVVRGVAPYSPAQKAGLQAGDVILKVDGREVRTPEDVSRSVRESAKSVVGLLIERDGGSAYVALRKPDGTRKD